MPKIKALMFNDSYRSEYRLVPIPDGYPVGHGNAIDAYLCPFSGRIFKSKVRYVSHLRHYRRDRIHNRVFNNKATKLIQQLSQVKSFDSLISVFNDNSRIFDAMTGGETLGFKIDAMSLRYDRRVRNSHSCPKTGVINVRAMESVPSHYPAWIGRIHYSYKENLTYYRTSRRYKTDVLSQLGINNGSGACIRTKGGVHSGEYGVVLWEDDFPELKRIREEEATMSVLSSGLNITSMDFFKWNWDDAKD